MININNITYRYPGQKTPVLSNFSLSLTEGRIYGLLGKNGTGKSTLLHLIAGLLRPQQGSVTASTNNAAMSGDKVPPTYERRPELLSELFLVSEDFELPAITLDDYVQLLLPFYPRFSREVLNNCLEAFELPRQMNLGQLSMGQKKKAYMSIALAANTRVLLMDEPTNGLDIPSKSQFRKVVAQCMADDRLIIVSTHQVHDVEQLLDHILILAAPTNLPQLGEASGAATSPSWGRQEGAGGLLLDASVADLTDRYVFEVRQPGQLDDTIIYAEPSLQGNIVMARRESGEAETLVNLELLFNAVTKGLTK